MSELQNAELIEAWDTILFDKFLQFEHLLTVGLGHHGTKLFELYPPKVGAKILDFGCGLGDTTAKLATLVGEKGLVVGGDCAPRFIVAAKERHHQTTAQFVVMDGENESDLGGPYDAIYSRFGTMFFVNPVNGFRNLCQNLKPGGELHVVGWRKRQDNPFIYRAQQIAEKYIAEEDLAPDQITCGPGPFANAGADMVSDILHLAGFENVTFCRFDAPVCIGRSVEEAVLFTTTMGPAGEKIRLAEAKSTEKAGMMKTKIENDLRKEYEPLLGEKGIWLPSSAWLISGTKKRPSLSHLTAGI